MDDKLRQALAEKLLEMADDEMILAQRDAEWTGHAPILEEDIAFANIALDEMGHAQTWYGLLAELTGQKVEQLIFFRPAAEFRNARLVELPKGDWAFTILRQYFFDAYERINLGGLIKSRYRPLAEAATKIRVEELYHYRHGESWVKRLGLGTEESNRRLQAAYEAMLPEVMPLVALRGRDLQLGEAGIIASPVEAGRAWDELVWPFLASAGIKLIERDVLFNSRRDLHTEHLEPLIAEMQFTARLDPQAEW
jgi:ring-1,2-phenylacetyl-CoA epoxidase subunit PaaC